MQNSCNSKCDPRTRAGLSGKNQGSLVYCVEKCETMWGHEVTDAGTSKSSVTAFSEKSWAILLVFASEIWILSYPVVTFFHSNIKETKILKDLRESWLQKSEISTRNANNNFKTIISCMMGIMPIFWNKWEQHPDMQ
jgi:hypothetical protein